MIRYTNIKFHTETLKKLRRFEVKNKLKPNVSHSVEHLLLIAELYKQSQQQKGH